MVLGLTYFNCLIVFQEKIDMNFVSTDMCRCNITKRNGADFPDLLPTLSSTKNNDDVTQLPLNVNLPDNFDSQNEKALNVRKY